MDNFRILLIEIKKINHANQLIVLFGAF